MTTPAAAVVLVVHPTDKTILVVWNKRYGGWAMPGGKVEEAESTNRAASRELLEETGLFCDTEHLRLIYEGPHGKSVESTRGSYVFVYRAFRCIGVASERERGCPTTYMTSEEFLCWSPFSDFYRVLLEKLRADGVVA